jgi:hypothetical protein
MAPTYLTLLLLAAAAAVAHRLYRYARLRHIPGPLLASLSSLWTLRLTLAYDSHLQLDKLCRKYGMRALSFATTIIPSFSFMPLGTGPIPPTWRPTPRPFSALQYTMKLRTDSWEASLPLRPRRHAVPRRPQLCDHGRRQPHPPNDGGALSLPALRVV